MLGHADGVASLGNIGFSGTRAYSDAVKAATLGATPKSLAIPHSLFSGGLLPELNVRTSWIDNISSAPPRASDFYSILTADLKVQRDLFKLGGPSYLRIEESFKKQTFGYKASLIGTVFEIDRLSQHLGSIKDSLRAAYGLTPDHFESAMQKMVNPWLDTASPLISAAAFGKLLGIGNLVSHFPTFNARSAKALRSDLGDFRDQITFPYGFGADADVRKSFYAERGLNQSLVDFPEPAFEETLAIAELSTNIPALISENGPPVSYSGTSREESELRRNNTVHDWLQRFEIQLRNFINNQMIANFGKDWPKHRLNNGIYEKWVDKQGKDTSGLQLPLIHYADFTDYMDVICKRDNWNKTFRLIFARVEFVRESFQRLYGPRVAVMHARPLIEEDVLFVYTEIKRITRLISF